MTRKGQPRKSGYRRVEVERLEQFPLAARHIALRHGQEGGRLVLLQADPFHLVARKLAAAKQELSAEDRHSCSGMWVNVGEWYVHVPGVEPLLHLANALQSRKRRRQVLNASTEKVSK
jgi:hypothetical protein